MIAKKFRFHGYGSLRFVYTKGRTVRVQFLSMKYIQNNRQKQSRVAVVVSKKITKIAPNRNRIRRRLYEVVRHQLSHINTPHDIVITVFDARVGEMPANELNDLIDYLFKQSQLKPNTQP